MEVRRVFIKGLQKRVFPRRVLTCLALILICAALAAPVHAQPPAPSYRIRDGRMYICVDVNMRRAALDSFIAVFGLNGIGLHQLVLNRTMDSLKDLGWSLDNTKAELKAMYKHHFVIISKPLLGLNHIDDPAVQMLVTEKHPTMAERFPAVNNGIPFGVNRFKNKAPFAEQGGTVRIFLRGFTKAKEVMLAGSFNNWVPNALAMTRTDSGWIADLQLGPGKYWYKFIADGRWMVDEDNTEAENDGEGNTNSVFYVTNTIFILPGYTHARRAYLAGSFNGWAYNQLRMNRTATGWDLPVYLAEGTHTYRFIVDGNWMEDPGNPDKLPNEFGEYNSVIRLGKPYIFELPGHLDAHEVILAGSFNRWRKDELFMKRTDSGWRLPYTLGAGNYEYGFSVDGHWVIDPRNPLYTRDETGKVTNSYLIIGANYTFRLKDHANAKTVFLAGDFNDWSPSSLSMRRVGDDWVYSVHLSTGKHLYKFIVDGEWIRDPDNKLWEENEYSTGNSVMWFDNQK